MKTQKKQIETARLPEIHQTSESDSNRADVAPAAVRPSSVATFLKDASSVAILFTFAFYIIGYVILHSYLIRFQIRLPAGSAFDCISAALCYVLFVSAIGLPSWLLLDILIQRAQNPSRENNLPLLIIFIWNTVLSRFIGLIFDVPVLIPFQSTSNYILWIVVFCHLSTLAFLKFWKKWPAVSKFLNGWIWFYFYLTLDQFIAFLQQPIVDSTFVLEAMALYATITNIPVIFRNNLQSLLRRIEVKIMVALLAICLILTNASHFGRKQYPTLPSTIGGGQPSRVFLKTTLATSVNSVRFDVPVTDGYIGPVLLLYKTDSEVAIMSETTIKTDPHSAVQIQRTLIEAIVTSPISSKKGGEIRPDTASAPNNTQLKQEEKTPTVHIKTPVKPQQAGAGPNPVTADTNLSKAPEGK